CWTKRNKPDPSETETDDLDQRPANADIDFPVAVFPVVPNGHVLEPRGTVSLYAERLAQDSRVTGGVDVVTRFDRFAFCELQTCDLIAFVHHFDHARLLANFASHLFRMSQKDRVI